MLNITNRDRTQVFPTYEVFCPGICGGTVVLVFVEELLSKYLLLFTLCLKRIGGVMVSGLASSTRDNRLYKSCQTKEHKIGFIRCFSAKYTSCICFVLSLSCSRAWRSDNKL